MTVQDLQASEYHDYYTTYLNLVPDGVHLLDAFKNNTITTLNFFRSISKDKLDYRYDEGKWSVKEVFQHLIDTERVFQFRCFHIGRHDKAALPGFEQNDYIEPSGADKKSIELLLEEFEAVRNGFITLLKGLTPEDLKQIGKANNTNTSARAIAFINLGHYIHHINITKERYL